jgi:hypothetical protein
MTVRFGTVTFHNSRMTTPEATRKDRARRKPKPPNVVRFHRALRRAGITAEGFAKAHRVSRFHLYLVLRSEREAPRLTAEIDAFMAKWGEEEEPPARRSA